MPHFNEPEVDLTVQPHHLTDEEKQELTDFFTELKKKNKIEAEKEIEKLKFEYQKKN